MKYFRLGMLSAIATSLTLGLTTAAFSMFGPLWSGGSVAVAPANNNKGLEDFTYSGAYGNWCATSSTCPTTAAYNLSWNLNARQYLGTGWERLEMIQSAMDGSCSGSPDFGSFGTAVNGVDPNIGMDATVSALQGIGIKIDMLIGALAPCETANGQAGWNPPASVSHWASHWVAPVVRHYSAMGVHLYEIWNEANGNWAWGGESPPDLLYTQMMCAAWSTIRGIDPTAIVMPSLSGTTGTTILDTTFLTSMYNDGLHGCMNALADHPYPSNGPTNNTLRGGAGNWERMYLTSPSLVGIMNANGDGNDKIYLTEIGCSPDAGATGASYAYCGNPSPTNPSINQQQQMILDAFNYAANGFPNLGPIFWWESFENANYACNAAATDPMDNCAGLYSGNGTARAAASTYASVSGRW